MRVHQLLTRDQQYPIPYINPPTELRLALRQEKKSVLLSCVRGNDVVFPTIEFGSPADFEILSLLVKYRQSDLAQGHPPENFEYLSAKNFFKELAVDGDALRRRIERLRKNIAAAVEVGWVDAVARWDMLIENRRGRGYRLAPNVRIVAAACLLS